MKYLVYAWINILRMSRFNDNIFFIHNENSYFYYNNMYT